MAEKILNTRIINKNADLETWSTSTLPLKTGEIALARVETTKPDGHGGYYTVPTYLMKVGDGEKTFSQLEWLAAPASDVYQWAKAATKPDYAATEITRGEGETKSTVDADLTTIETAIKDLQDAIGEGGSVADAIADAIEKLDVDASTDTEGVVISSISEADGKISVTRRALTDADIASLNVAMDKVTGLADALALKADKAEIGTSADLASTPTVYGAIAGVKATAEAATTVDEATQIAATAVSNFNTETIVPLTNRVTTVEGKVDALSSATHFLGVKTELPTTANKGDIVIVGNKEYVYDPEATITIEGTNWVELGDTTAELAAIDALDDRVELVEKDLAEGGTTFAKIKAAQDKADANEAAIAVINGEAEGSIKKAAADAVSEAKTYTDGQIETVTKATGKVAEDLAAYIEANDKAVAAADQKGQKGIDDAAKVAQDLDTLTKGAVKTNTDNIATIQNNYARVEGDALVYGQGENLMTIVFDCGGAN